MTKYWSCCTAVTGPLRSQHRSRRREFEYAPPREFQITQKYHNKYKDLLLQKTFSWLPNNGLNVNKRAAKINFHLTVPSPPPSNRHRKIWRRLPVLPSALCAALWHARGSGQGAGYSDEGSGCKLWVSITGWDMRFFCTQKGLRPTKTHSQTIKGIPSPGEQQPKREAVHSPPYSAEVKSECGYIATTPQAFLACMGTAHRQIK